MSTIGRILVMDDEKPVRDVTREILRYIGYEVTTARDGIEAIRLYREAQIRDEPYDVVILDLIVPGRMGGENVLQQLIEIDSHVKAIACSGYSDNPVMANFRDYGFRGAITKPYQIKELGLKLHTIIKDES